MATAGRSMSRDEQRELAELSPFEMKARLLERGRRAAAQMAPRCSTPGAAIPTGSRPHRAPRSSCSGEFALGESRARVAGARPRRACPAARRHRRPLRAVPRRARRDAAAPTCSRRRVEYGASLGFDADEFVYELADGIIGDHYPGPDRICVHAERILREYLADELCQGEPPDGDLEPLRGRGRHRGDLLHLRFARQQLAAAARATASR